MSTLAVLWIMEQLHVVLMRVVVHEHDAAVEAHERLMRLRPAIRHRLSRSSRTRAQKRRRHLLKTRRTAHYCWLIIQTGTTIVVGCLSTEIATELVFPNLQHIEQLILLSDTVQMVPDGKRFHVQLTAYSSNAHRNGA